MKSRVLRTLIASLGVTLAGHAGAATIAVFGDNQLDNFLNANGHTATLVSDAQLATAGFLNSFDAFLYTRNGSGFGSSLSAAAAANVSGWATGNAVAMNGDWADPFLGNASGEPSANVQQLWLNVVSFAAAAGNGFIGEFNGAVAAFSLGIISGSAGGQACCAGDGNVNAEPANAGHPILAGVTMPFNPGDVEFAASITVDPSLVIARYGSGNAAIVARGSIDPVPAPTALALMGLGLVGLGARRRRV